MANAQYVDFNPSQFQPAGEPTRVNSPSSGDGYQGMDVVSQPVIGPNGERLVKLTVNGQDGGYATPGQGNTWTAFRQGPNGQWVASQQDGSQGIFKDITSDGRLMTFLAVAAGGAALGSTYGAGGAGGSMLGSGTGATPGVVAGGTMGSSGLGAATGTGMLGTMGGTGSMSAGELAAMDAAGGAQAGTGLPAAAGGAGASNGLLSQFGISPDLAKVIGGVGGAVFNGWNNNQYQDKLNDAIRGANQTSIDASRAAGESITNTANASSGYLVNQASHSADRMVDAGNRAADMSTFRPYNVTGGLAGASFNGNTVTKTLDPRLKAIQDQSLGSAQGFLGSVNAGTPEQLAQQAYTNYNKWAKPAQDQQFAGLQDRLAAQGMLGLNVNTGNLQGQGNVSVNPYYKDFAQGVALADLKNYENSVNFGQQTTANQIGLGNSMLGIGVGIDNLGNEAIKMGQSLGDSQATAGARAGGFLTGAAQQAGAWQNSAAQQAGQWNNSAANNAAMLNHDAAVSAAQNWAARQQGEAGSDAARNRAIWDSIWKTL